MTSPQTRVNALWTDLETNYGPGLTRSDHRELRQMDAAAIDDTLSVASFERTKRHLMANRRRSYAVDHRTGKIDPVYHTHRNSREAMLFGDHELIIDSCLAGDPAVKAAVRRADNDGRRGLASLRYHLGTAKAPVPPHLATILRACEADQEYHDNPARRAVAARADMKNIEERGGRYRVTVMTSGKRHRETFKSLQDAREYRDRHAPVKSPT